MNFFTRFWMNITWREKKKQTNRKPQESSIRGGSSGLFSWLLILHEVPAVSPSQWHCRDLSLPAARSAWSPSPMPLIGHADGCCWLIKRSLCPRNSQGWVIFFLIFIYSRWGHVSPSVNEGCVTCCHPAPHNSQALTAPSVSLHHR